MHNVKQYIGIGLLPENRLEKGVIFLWSIGHVPFDLARTHHPESVSHNTTTPNPLPRPNSRNAIFEAGTKLFIERGYNGCSVQDITEAAGIPKGSFYNHFKSKEALAAGIVTEYGKGSTDRSILANAELPALTRLKKHFAALNDYFSQCSDGCLVGKFMAEVSADTPLIRDSLQGVLSLWREQISSAIAEGQKQGSIRKDLKANELATFLIDAYEGAILRTRVEESPAALKSFVKIVFASIVA
jgi:TetR/AcrR family transcriptional repressor of nem operon